MASANIRINKKLSALFVSFVLQGTYFGSHTSVCRFTLPRRKQVCTSSIYNGWQVVPTLRRCTRRFGIGGHSTFMTVDNVWEINDQGDLNRIRNVKFFKNQQLEMRADRDGHIGDFYDGSRSKNGS